MRLTHRRTLALCAAAALALAAPAVAAAHGSGHGHGDHHGKGLRAVKRIVVIYEENHSFDNLYGGWEGVNGLRRRRRRAHDAGQPGGTPYTCLLAERRQPDVAAAAATCTTRRPRAFDEPLPQRARSTIDDFIAPDGHDVPGARRVRGQRRAQGQPRRCRAAARATSCTATTRSSTSSTAASRTATSTGSDAVGLTMGAYDTRALPIYKYLHSRGHPDYAIADDFFQAAFGGSFLNHQWLVAAATPTWPNAVNDGSKRQRPALGGRRQRDADQLPARTPRPARRRPVKDGALTASCHPARAAADAGRRDVRRLRRQHDPADLPALPARHRATRASSRRRRRRRSATA